MSEIFIIEISQDSGETWKPDQSEGFKLNAETAARRAYQHSLHMRDRCNRPETTYRARRYVPVDALATEVV